MHSGDTAQTIAKGLSFRFKDVQSLYYDAANSLAEPEPALAPRTAPAVEMPALEQLGVNYRSHSGILRIANTVRQSSCVLPWLHASGAYLCLSTIMFLTVNEVCSCC